MNANITRNVLVCETLNNGTAVWHQISATVAMEFSVNERHGGICVVTASIYT